MSVMRDAESGNSDHVYPLRQVAARKRARRAGASSACPNATASDLFQVPQTPSRREQVLRFLRRTFTGFRARSRPEGSGTPSAAEAGRHARHHAEDFSPGLQTCSARYSARRATSGCEAHSAIPKGPVCYPASSPAGTRGNPHHSRS